MAKNKIFAVIKGIAVRVASNTRDDYFIHVDVTSFTVNRPKKITYTYPEEQRLVFRMCIPHSSQNAKWLRAVATGANLTLYVERCGDACVVTSMDCALPTTKKLESVLYKLDVA